MKKEVMQKWVEALRSGKYVQGTHVLCNSNYEYCCLGGLCDLYKNKLNVEQTFSPVKNNNVFTFDGDSISLPNQVIYLAGIKQEYGQFRDKNNQLNSLAILNDNGYSFNELADIIDANYEAL